MRRSLHGVKGYEEKGYKENRTTENERMGMEQ